MFERFISFLRELPATPRGEQDDDPRIAAAALLFHVMNADGMRQDIEHERIKAVLGELYHLTGSKLDRLLEDGENADNEAVDLYTFTSVLKRHLDEASRIDFIRVMWEVCYADGDLHELEDNILWRVSELLGVGSRERVMARQAARDNGRKNIN